MIERSIGMKKKFLLSICFVMCSLVLMTACKNEQSGTTGEKTPVQTQTSQSKGDIPKPAPEVAAFTQKYLEAYEGEENAVIQLCFADKNEIPSEVLDKIRTVEVEIQPREEQEATGYEDEEYYSLIIGCQEGSLYQVNTYQGDFSVKTEEVFYMAKGDAFLIPSNTNNKVFSEVNVDSPDGRHSAKVSIYYNWYGFQEMKEAGVIDKRPVLHSVYTWEKEPVNSVFYQEVNQYPTQFLKSRGRVDLDGDKKEELIYFQDTFEYFKEEASESSTIVQGRLVIDDRDYPFEELDHFFDGDRELYNDGFRDIEIIDLDESDSYKEIVLQKQPQIEPMGRYAIILRYDKGELHPLGGFYSAWEDNIASITNPKEKTVEVMQEGGGLFMNYYRKSTYQLKGDKIEPIPEETHKMSLYNQKLILSIMKPLNFYEEKESEQPMEMLKSGSILLFLETDAESWVKVKDFDTGKTGYLRFESDVENYGWKMYGQPELGDPYYIFFNLPAWG